MRYSTLGRRMCAALLVAVAASTPSPLAGQAARVMPAPADVIGFAPGEDYKLADYDQITAYFRALAAASDRVVLEQIGTSTLGKPLLMAVISSEEKVFSVKLSLPFTL